MDKPATGLDDKMFTRFEPTKSTKGASKMRRDLINAEIANLRDLLPLPPSTRQRLSQLQLMALICVYVRKENYFQQVLKCHDFTHHYNHHAPTPNIGFSKALNGFLMMMTQNGKLLYISDNAAEYLGHSMEDLLIHGDSVYDIIDKQDHQAVQAELCRSATPAATPPALDSRMFLCRINVARNARRQMRFGDQKVVLVRGHFLSFLPLCSRNEPVFLAACSPVAMPETRECVVQGATNVFTTIHSMDMKIKHVDKNGEWYLGWDKADLQGVSWYQLLHWECMREAQSKHRLITQSEQERSCILLLRLQRRSGEWLWVHAVLQVKDNMENNQQPVIVCTNQVLSESEATIMLANAWLYHYYSVQSKLQYGLAYDTQLQNYYHPSMSNFSPSPYTVNQESPYSQPSSEDMVHHMNGEHHQGHAELQQLHSRQGTSPGVLRHVSGHPDLQQLQVTRQGSSPGVLQQLQPTRQGSPPSMIDVNQLRQETSPSVLRQMGHPEQMHLARQGPSPGGPRQVGGHPDLQQLQAVRQGTSPSVLRHSGGQLVCVEGFGFEASMAERGPVDYSRHSSVYAASNERYVPQVDIDVRLSGPREGEAIPSIRYHRKRKHSESLTRLEPLQISKQSHVIVEGGGGTLLALHPAEIRRYPLKPGMEDPADFIDRWNPSPPWSDTTLQKVPLSYQEVSYISSAPLTPTGTPSALSSYGGLQNTFTFDWLPEHYVSQPVLHIVCREDENYNSGEARKLRLTEAAENQMNQQNSNPDSNVEASSS